MTTQSGFLSGWAELPESAPAAERPRYRPGHARVGEPTPQSHPDRFTDAELLAEFRYLGRLNGRHGVHPLRVGAQNKLVRELVKRGHPAPVGWVTGEPEPVAPARPAPVTTGRPGGQTYLRSCSGCSAHLACNDPTSQNVWCGTCKPKHVKPFDAWAAGLKPGDRVYVQPYAAWRGLSHSEYLITARDGDTLTVQVLGIPESSMTVAVHHCGQHDLTPRRTH